MEIVAGLSLKNLRPRVWNPESPEYLPALRAVMVSYAELHQQPWRRRDAMERGLRAHLGLPEHLRLYVDNGAFHFASRGIEPPLTAYDEFTSAAGADWRPIPYDAIPSPVMSIEEQRACLARTMDISRAYQADGYVPVIHACEIIGEYIAAIIDDDGLAAKPALALGALVPQLLRSPKARPYAAILDGLREARRVFAGKRLHLFGVGGTATLHLAALLGMDSADSSGWRNRAARGTVQLPGSGDRMVAELGRWRGREPSAAEWDILRACPCPACRNGGLEGLKASGVTGFSHRAAHNLWILLEEARWIEERLAAGSYSAEYEARLDNSIYKPLIHRVVEQTPRVERRATSKATPVRTDNEQAPVQ